MKKTLTTILLLTLLASTSLAWPFNKQPTLQPTPVAVVKPTPKPTIQDGRDLAKGIVAELKTAKEENTKLKTSLDKAVEQTEQAESKTLEVQKSADTLKEWGMIQQAEAQKFMEKYNNAVKRYHRLKVIAAFIQQQQAFCLDCSL